MVAGFVPVPNAVGLVAIENEPAILDGQRARLVNISSRERSGTLLRLCRKKMRLGRLQFSLRLKQPAM